LRKNTFGKNVNTPIPVTLTPNFFKMIFKEKQKFDQWWLCLLLLGVGLILLYGGYQQLILGEAFGTNPATDTEIIFIVGGYTLFLLFFLLIRLETEIDEKGIELKFFPFPKKKISWGEIKTAEVINYGFVGGWGIRLGTKYGTAYNTKGNIS
jgi:hypothetical protein